MARHAISPYWFLLCGLATFILGAGEAAREIRLSLEGTAVMARITGFLETHGRGAANYPQLELGVPVPVANCTTGSSAWFWERPRTGDIIPAIYSTRDGMQCEINRLADRWLAPVMLMGIGILLSFPGVLLLQQRIKRK